LLVETKDLLEFILGEETSEQTKKLHWACITANKYASVRDGPGFYTTE